MSHHCLAFEDVWNIIYHPLLYGRAKEKQILKCVLVYINERDIIILCIIFSTVLRITFYLLYIPSAFDVLMFIQVPTHVERMRCSVKRVYYMHNHRHARRMLMNVFYGIHRLSDYRGDSGGITSAQGSMG